MLEITSTRSNPGIDPALHVWGWEIPLYLFVGGLVAGMMVLAGVAMLRTARGEDTKSFFSIQTPLLGFMLLNLGMLALLLDLAASPTLYDSDHMVFSADGISRSYFQFAQWSERPARSLLRLSESRLAAAGKFSSVASSSSGLRGDLLLTLRLDELYLDDTRRPGRVQLSFTATLLDWRQRRLIARRSFSGTQDAVTQDAAGLAGAASVVLGALLGELVDWAGASAAAA